ncbi:MAG TPA: chemotaxis protein CheW [Kofleriaceae bacterium]|nr:chemotaxis protein CheW [Kofleriaceae bacterium]
MTQSHVLDSQHLSFFIGAEQYGLGILEAREILQYPAVTAVPSRSRAIRGVINLRGTAVPVVDLAAVFGHGVQPITSRTCVVVVASQSPNGESTLIGLVVERVHQVFELRSENIERVPELGMRSRAKFFRGLNRTNDGFVLLLDLPRVLEHVDFDEDLLDIGVDEPPLAEAEPAACHVSVGGDPDPQPETEESSQP